MYSIKLHNTDAWLGKHTEEMKRERKEKNTREREREELQDACIRKKLEPHWKWLEKLKKKKTPLSAIFKKLRVWGEVKLDLSTGNNGLCTSIYINNICFFHLRFCPEVVVWLLLLALLDWFLEKKKQNCGHLFLSPPQRNSTSHFPWCLVSENAKRYNNFNFYWSFVFLTKSLPPWVDKAARTRLPPLRCSWCPSILPCEFPDCSGPLHHTFQIAFSHTDFSIPTF